MAPVKPASFFGVTLLLGVLAWGLASCGDALVDEDYLGTPRFTLGGLLIGNSTRVDAENPEVRVALFWVTSATHAGETLVEQEGTTRTAEYYRPFMMKLFDEPQEEALLSQRPGARLGVARVLAYQDENGNGRKDKSEPLLGNSFLRVLLRAPQSLSAADSLTGAPLEEGWYVVSTPLSCPLPPNGTPSSPSGEPDGDCGVPLGEPCRADADCLGGTCVLESGGPWPSGACAIPEPPPNGCRQRGSVLMRVPGDTLQGYWIKACKRTADCGRPPPYQCDQQIRGCMPTEQIVVELSDQERQATFCQARGP